MPLSREDVEHAAQLAYVGIDAEELDRLTDELSSIVDHVARLQQVDTAGIAPTSHTQQLMNVMREDIVEPSWPVEAVMANAPRRRDDFFEVQAVLD